MKKNKKKVILMLLGFLIIACALILIFSEDTKEADNVVLKDSISEYSYTLDERDSDFFENEYEILKSILLENEIDYTAYAEQLSKLFIIDFYSLNTKLNKYDVGGLEYLNDKIKENFKLKAENSIYKYHGTMDQLPEVSSIVINEILEVNINFDKQDYTGYEINLNWEYKEDLGYDNSGIIKFILNNNKLEIIEFIGVNQ